MLEMRMRLAREAARREVLSSGGSGLEGPLLMFRGSRLKLVGEGGPER